MSLAGCSQKGAVSWRLRGITILGTSVALTPKPKAPRERELQSKTSHEHRHKNHKILANGIRQDIKKLKLHAPVGFLPLCKADPTFESSQHNASRQQPEEPRN